MPDDPKKVKWSDLLKGLSGIEVGKPLDVQVQKETIPIVFVPGIMGTRLARGKDKIWDPDSAFFMFRNYGTIFATATRKKNALVGKRYDPEDLQPYEIDGEDYSKVDAGTPAAWGTAASKGEKGEWHRGWGSVLSGSYGAVLRELQAMAGQQGFPAVVSAFFDFPVYGNGYNWTASNEDSGRKLAARIKEIKQHHVAAGELCEKVIVVTHSMGGLVTRWAVEKGGAKDDVLGVIHGVQPATGAPAAYWRIKGGFERPRGGSIKDIVTTWVLGSNGKEVTALLASIPGGLQLLPGPGFADNAGGKKWLRLCDAQGKELAAHGDDAYEKVYKNRDALAYWRLCDEPLLLPEKAKPELVWQEYCDRVDTAKEFHEDVAEKAHPETQAFYGAGKAHATADVVEFHGKIHDWRAEDKSPATQAAVVKWVVAGGAAPSGVKEEKREMDYGGGEFKCRVRTNMGTIDVVLRHPADVADARADHGGGDGTVPESSGRALKQTGVGGGVEAQKIDGIGHEPAYQHPAGAKPGPDGRPDPTTDGVEFTIQAILKLCKDRIKKAK